MQLLTLVISISALILSLVAFIKVRKVK